MKPRAMLALVPGKGQNAERMGHRTGKFVIFLFSDRVLNLLGMEQAVFYCVCIVNKIPTFFPPVNMILTVVDLSDLHICCHFCHEVNPMATD